MDLVVRKAVVEDVLVVAQVIVKIPAILLIVLVERHLVVTIVDGCAKMQLVCIIVLVAVIIVNIRVYPLLVRPQAKTFL